VFLCQFIGIAQKKGIETSISCMPFTRAMALEQSIDAIDNKIDGLDKKLAASEKGTNYDIW